MIGPIEFALISGAVLAMFTFYKAQTMHMALNAREAMADAVCKILNDPQAPRELKLKAIAAFHFSTDTFSVLRAVVFAFFKPREPAPSSLNGEHQEALRNLIRTHFQRVNMLAAPHYYLLFWFLVFVTVLAVSVLTLGQKSGFRYVQRSEEVMINPPLNDRQPVLLDRAA